jgi:ubiquinone/menaquinone biosynthesis C-methylase UbiE
VGAERSVRARRVLVVIDEANISKGVRKHWRGSGRFVLDPVALAEVVIDKIGQRAGIGAVDRAAEVVLCTGEPLNPAWSMTNQFPLDRQAWQQRGASVLTHPLRMVDGKPKQDGVDVLIGVEVVLAAERDQADLVVLVSGDSDLEPAIVRAQDILRARAATGLVAATAASAGHRISAKVLNVSLQPAELGRLDMGGEVPVYRKRPRPARAGPRQRRRAASVDRPPPAHLGEHPDQRQPPAGRPGIAHPPGGGDRSSAAHYDRIAPVYDQLWSHPEAFVTAMTAAIAEALQLAQHDRLLDVGAGTGLYARRLHSHAKMRFAVHCADPSAGMVAQLRGVAGIKAVRQGLLELVEAPPRGPFDAVLIKEALHHIEPADHERAFRGLIPQCAPGGRVLVVMRPSTIDHPLFDAALRRFEQLQPAPQLVEKAMAAAGLQVWGTERSIPVSLPKAGYVELVRARHMSVLSHFDDPALEAGIAEIDRRHPEQVLEFTDRFVFLLGRVSASPAAGTSRLPQQG